MALGFLLAPFIFVVKEIDRNYFLVKVSPFIRQVLPFIEYTAFVTSPTSSASSE